MAEEKQKEKIIVKKIDSGDYGIFANDKKTNQLIQIGFIGKNLPLEAYIPAGAVVEK